MSPFHITWIWILLFTTGCISQSKPSNLTLNTDSENLTRSQTHWSTHEIKHIWAIKQFSLHEKFNTSYILSPVLHASTTDKYEWYAEFKPNEIDNGYKSIALFIFLSNGSTVREVTAECNVSIINEKKEVLHSKPFEMLTKKYKAAVAGGGWGWPAFLQRNDFFRNQILQNDTLTLLICIRWISELSNDDTPHQLEISSSSRPKPETTTTKSNLPENLESMLENPNFADVVFITNGSNYPAHKNILAARSPVFAAMFRQKDSKNGKLKKIRINVTPMNEKVLRAMLRYIYTEKCEELGDLTGRLFEAAVKYGLEGLREICEQLLCENLTEENADDMFVFAKKHHANELKSKVIEFLSSRSAHKLNKIR
ncbi:speckle-type POZ protein-like [Planococcus citri]|uniref:speckle-type POZ protein-like n=1 Tax=Planococcus citri TaxID=170843 RepID=UPI0031F913C3